MIFAYVKFVTVSWSKKFSDDSKIWLKSYLGPGQFYGHTFHDYGNIPHKIIYDYEKRGIKYFGLQEGFILCATHKYNETLVSLGRF